MFLLCDVNSSCLRSPLIVIPYGWCACVVVKLSKNLYWYREGMLYEFIKFKTHTADSICTVQPTHQYITVGEFFDGNPDYHLWILGRSLKLQKLSKMFEATHILFITNLIYCKYIHKKVYERLKFHSYLMKWSISL